MVDIKSEVLSAARNSLTEALTPKSRKISSSREKNDGTTAYSSAAVLREGSVSNIHRLSIAKVVHATELDDLVVDALFDPSGIQIAPQISIHFVAADIYSWVSGRRRQSNDNKYDAVVASAFLDLFDLRVMVELLFSLLSQEDGARRVFYFPINFDGVTCLQPASDTGSFFDSQIESIFHNSMGVDEADQGASRSQTGRRLLPLLQALGAVEIVAGSSSWIVQPSDVNSIGNARYIANEQYFLESILEFILNAVGSQASRFGENDRQKFAQYASSRKTQIRQCELSYVAHNMDYCGRVGRE